MAVGNESQSGDAIAVRFGDLHGAREEQTVVIIDGGFTDTGKELADFIEKHYSTSQVDLVISTHPDADHINGLSYIIENLTVGELWIHKPWEHIEGIADKFKDGRVTDNSIGEKLKESLESAYALCQLAESKGVVIKEPFTGLTDASGCIKVLGPKQDYYEELVLDFDGLPKKKEEDDRGFFAEAAKAIARFVKELWHEDSLTDDGETSPKNNSSVVTQMILDENRMLFTGDAGIPALEKVADELEACFDPAKLKFIQIPHHGSHRNIGPTVLNRIVGEPITQGEDPHFSAFVSSAKKGEPKHPNKKVLNAFTRRGARTHTTQGSSKCHFNDAPEREGYSTANPVPFYEEVEE